MPRDLACKLFTHISESQMTRFLRHPAFHLSHDLILVIVLNQFVSSSQIVITIVVIIRSDWLNAAALVCSKYMVKVGSNFFGRRVRGKIFPTIS